MTGPNREMNAAEELARAEVCLNEARTLQQNGLPYGAASRAYYAVFHAARALLFSAGIEPRSHRGLVSLLGDHFIKTGRLSAERGRVVARMQRDREDADYMVGAVFTLEQGAEAVSEAQQFLDEARAIVASCGGNSPGT